MLFVIANWKWLLGAAATAILATLLATTTIDRNQWRAAARKADATLAQIEVAEKQATAAAQAAHDAQEQLYKDLANAADKDHASALADAGVATDRYISAHSVPACPAGGAASRPAQAASSSNPASSVSADPAPGMVAVSPESIHICTDNTLRLEAAQDWAASLGQ
jgi:hypothetical protein